MTKMRLPIQKTFVSPFTKQSVANLASSKFSVQHQQGEENTSLAIESIDHAMAELQAI